MTAPASHNKALLHCALVIGILSVVGVGIALYYAYGEEWLASFQSDYTSPSATATPVVLGEEDTIIPVTLTECTDGDTFTFSTDTTVKHYRLLGIDAPETSGVNAGYGQRAADYACHLLESAQVIEIQYDPKSELADKYNRDLVWVWIDGELLQFKLVNEGWAECRYQYDDYLYNAYLQEAQTAAQKAKKNIWQNSLTPLEDR